MEKLSDISLVTKVVMLHDRKSFDLLVRKYQSPIRGFFLRQTLGDAQLSDDLAQDTFVKAYTHLSGFRVLFSLSSFRASSEVALLTDRPNRRMGRLEE